MSYAYLVMSVSKEGKEAGERRALNTGSERGFPPRLIRCGIVRWLL